MPYTNAVLVSLKAADRKDERKKLKMQETAELVS